MESVALEYHDVIEEAAFAHSGFGHAGAMTYKMTPALFAAHMDRIARLAGSAPMRVTDGPIANGRLPIYLTFDDGGVAAHSHIADALERHDWRGHFFVTAGRIDTPGFLSTAEIRDLHRRGHVIGTHSLSHPRRMGACTPAEILNEWTQSTRILSDIVGQAVTVGSVPGGYYTSRVGHAAALAGLRVLFTSVPTSHSRVIDGCRLIGRYSLRSWTSPAAAAALAAGRWAPRASQWMVYHALWVLRTVLGDAYTRARDRFWASRR
jgi:peptidoglycan/xylan/chitin deacetylase (PgdA/CDA1 family)